MARVSRRNFLKLSGGGAIAAKTGGIAAILASGRAPAFAQATNVHWLRWVDFVPASDEVMRKEIVPACQKALGITLKFETINANDIQARTTAAIQSGAGPDVICGVNNWPQLYAESVVDVSDLAEEIGKAQEGFYTVSRAVANDGKKWIGVPWCIVGAQIAYRKSWFEEAGYSKFPETWEEYREAKRKPDAYQTEKGTPLWQDILHAPLPKGAAGQFSYHLPMSNMLMGYSKNQQAAKEFLRWITSKDVFQIWFNSQQGYTIGATTVWEKDPVWGKDPVMLPYRSAARNARFAGFAGPPDRKAAEVLSKYIIIDMYAKAAQGMPAEEAVKWAHEEVKKIHT